jgi:hypothetical protein
LHLLLVYLLQLPHTLGVLLPLGRHLRQRKRHRK